MSRVTPSPPVSVGSGVAPARALAADTYEPTILRTIAGRTSETSGFKVGSNTYNGTVDSIFQFGHFGDAAGVPSSIVGLEIDWVPAPGQNHITELYWEVKKANGVGRRMIYGKYDRTMERAIQWKLIVGNGIDGPGAASPGYEFNWDDDSSESGGNFVKFNPNRFRFFPINSGGIAADRSELLMYSVAAKGTRFAMTYGGADPEGFAATTFAVTTESANYVQVFNQGKILMKFSNDGANPQIGFLGVEPSNRKVAAAAAADLATAITLVNSLRTGLIGNGLFS